MVVTFINLLQGAQYRRKFFSNSDIGTFGDIGPLPCTGGLYRRKFFAKLCRFFRQIRRYWPPPVISLIFTALHKTQISLTSNQFLFDNIEKFQYITNRGDCSALSEKVHFLYSITQNYAALWRTPHIVGPTISTVRLIFWNENVGRSSRRVLGKFLVLASEPYFDHIFDQNVFLSWI